MPSFKRLRAAASLGVGNFAALQLYAFAPLRLAVLLQQPAPPVHALAHGADLALWDHPLDDAEALDSQRLQVPLDLRVTALWDTRADGVGESQPIIKI